MVRSPKAACVLIADDEATVRSMLRRFLEGKGFQVVEAEHGREVFHPEILEQTDLILLDLAMPEMDGIEVLRTLRAKGLNIPVIAISGAVGGSHTLKSAQYLGAQTVLSKPFDLSILLRTIEETLAEDST
ncbi:MAG: response regulator [Planctomycetota bacterium]|nr:MAG: response regulator [Planctomycetota bacterium]